MTGSVEEKLAKLQALLKKKEEINAEIEALLSAGKEAVLPVGFALNTEVLAIVAAEGVAGIDAKKVLKTMHAKYPQYDIDRKRIASALAYLKNSRKEIEQIGRGVYRAIESA